MSNQNNRELIELLLKSEHFMLFEFIVSLSAMSALIVTKIEVNEF